MSMIIVCDICGAQAHLTRMSSPKDTVTITENGIESTRQQEWTGTFYFPHNNAMVGAHECSSCWEAQLNASAAARDARRKG